MNDLLKQLHDIEIIFSASNWPLALGWWCIIALVTIIKTYLVIILYRKYKFRRTWNYDTLQQLANIEAGFAGANADVTAETVAKLSELIRRIAIHKYSRQQCAGLEGAAWLKWLTEHDPKLFDWQTKAYWLINSPYAPSATAVSLEQFRAAIKALKTWIK